MPVRGRRLDGRLHVFVFRLVRGLRTHPCPGHVAVRLDDEDRARCSDEADVREVLVDDLVPLDGLVLVIGQEGERQALLLLEFGERKRRVDADSVHGGVELLVIGDRVAKRAELLGADARERRGKEREDGDMPVLGEGHRLALGVKERDVRGVGSDLDCHALPPRGLGRCFRATACWHERRREAPVLTAVRSRSCGRVASTAKS